MRIGAVAKVPGIRARFLLGLLGFIMRKDSPLDVLKTVYHDPKLFGDAYLALLNDVMRGPSDWSVAERELFATYTSKLNVCPFCEGSHAAVYTHASGGAQAEAILGDPRNPQVDPKVKATLALIEKMNRSPEAIGPADVEAIRATGVCDAAIEDAVHVAFCFHIINRLANALDFHVSSPEVFHKVGATLLKRGYRL